MDTNAIKSVGNWALPPCRSPYSNLVCQKLRYVAGSSRLWFDWEFEVDPRHKFGFVACGMCKNSQTSRSLISPRMPLVMTPWDGYGYHTHRGPIPFRLWSASWLKKVKKVSLSEDRNLTLDGMHFRFSGALKQCDMLPGFKELCEDLQVTFESRHIHRIIWRMFASMIGVQEGYELKCPEIEVVDIIYDGKPSLPRLPSLTSSEN